MIGRHFCKCTKKASHVPLEGTDQSHDNVSEGTTIRSEFDLPAEFDVPEAKDKAAHKLRYVMDEIRKDEEPSDTVQENLLYAIHVLESAYIEEYKRLKSMGDELEALSKHVSRDVRDWLEMTFTRGFSLDPRERRTTRGVAQGIREGSTLDRAHRQHFPQDVANLFEDIDSWSFDIFALTDKSNGEPVKYLGFDLFIRYGVVQKFKIPSPVLQAFLEKIEEGYLLHNNSYHNNLHSADVTQCFHYMLYHSGITNWLSDLDVFAMLVAALIHDFEHTGTTNAFHVSSNSDMALLYNDKSVLENYHVSKTFSVLQDERRNIIKNLSRDEYRDFRALVIECVLATDMTFHFQHIKNMRNLLSLAEPITDRPKVLGFLLHCCDIAHPAKDWNLHSRWVDMLMDEFFKQGDEELALGLPYSPMCDRKSTNIPHSQVSFIEVIVEPTMKICSRLLEEIYQPYNAPKEKREGGEKAEGTKRFIIKKPWVECLKDNKRRWKKLEKEAAGREKSADPPPADGTKR